VTRRGPREDLVAAVLDAVADGQLSAEQLVRAASSAPGFDRAARRWLAAAADAERQRPRVRHVAHEPAVLRKARRALHRRMAGRPGVHVGLGRHYRDGQALDEFGLVAHVVEKRDVPGEHAIRPITVEHDGATYTLRCDVKQIERAHKQAQLRPGNQAVVGSGVEHGTLSGIVQRPGGPVALISGHVAKTASGGAIRAREAGGSMIDLGSVIKLRDDATMDAAVVGTVPKSEVAVLTLGPADVRAPSTIFKGIAVKVLATEHGGARGSFVDDVSVPATFAGATMTGLIALAPRVTDGGDSGAAVLDDQGRVLGFVVGASASRTFIISAKEVLGAMLGL
jgi:hypothetical protein